MMFQASYMFFCGIFSFICLHLHVLMMLFSLEFSLLGLLFMFICYQKLLSSEIYFYLLFLTLMVCEGAMGLSLIILLNRSYGGDYILNLSLLEW